MKPTIHHLIAAACHVSGFERRALLTARIDAAVLMRHVVMGLAHELRLADVAVGQAMRRSQQGLSYGRHAFDLRIRRGDQVLIEARADVDAAAHALARGETLAPVARIAAPPRRTHYPREIVPDAGPVKPPAWYRPDARLVLVAGRWVLRRSRPTLPATGEAAP